MRFPVVLCLAPAAALIALACAAPATAQLALVPPPKPVVAPPAPGETERGLVRATPRTGEIRLDGRLDDAAWADAVPVSSFTQRGPDEGRPVSERTEVRIVFDAEALYVGARLDDRGAVSAPLGRRDMLSMSSDWLGVMLDTRHDHRTAVSFWVNPAGVRTDGAVSDEGIAWSWNAVWDARTSVDSAGWTAEVRIPLSQLRFSAGDVQEWGVQLQRTIGRRGEEAFSAFTPRSERDGVARYGHLRGLRGLQPGQRLEVAPYTVARSERIDPGANPFRGDAETGASVGVDLRLRLSSSLVLDATVNPDFGTVEADPAEVNLSAFETAFSEQRPFFVEGADLFDFGRGAVGAGALNRRLIYPRRIGRRPQLGAPVAAADAPRTATILGAAKLTGRTAGGWSLGGLGALTQEERLRWRNADGAEHTGVAEPRSTYLVGRATRAFGGGRSWVGAIGTAVRRSLGDSAAAASLRSAAYVGGVDFAHEFAARTWRLSGYLAASRVEGSTEAMTATQASSAHNFARPDAAHLRLDSAATSLAGWTGQLQLARQAGEHWLGEAWVSSTSPGFQANDLGFHARADQRVAGGRLAFQENRPSERLRSYRVEGAAVAWFNHGGERVGNTLFLGSTWQTPSFWRLTANVGGSLANPVHDRLTRGGPASGYPGEWRVLTELASDSRRPVTAGASFFTRRGEAGWERTVAGRVHLQPTPRWSLGLEPALVRTHAAAQYVRAVDDATATGTFGRRYVFAPLDQTTLSVGTRLNMAFTPDLSLQLYAQPFLSAGDFGAYREFTTPRGFAFAEYGRDRGTVRPAEGGGVVVDPDGPEGAAREFTVGAGWGQRDFNLRSLRGSAVLRWEWRPGSTLFLAWQQERESRLSDTGDFRPGRDLGGLLGSAPDNVLVLKATYWFAP